MASTVHCMTFDARDTYEQARFWASVLGVPMSPDDQPGDPEALLRTPRGDILFVHTPDGKHTKNRAHLDLEPSDCTREEEVERILALGATLFQDHRSPDGRGWVTMTDPEGNEFCVVRSAAERT